MINASQGRGSKMLRDMDEKDRIRDLKDIDYRAEFDQKRAEFTPGDQNAINADCGGL